MKLHEIKMTESTKLDSEGFFMHQEDIEKYCLLHNIKDYHLSQTGISLDSGRTYSIESLKSENYDHLPIKIVQIFGDLDMSSSTMKSLKGLPKHIDGNLDLVFMTRLDSLEFLPEKIDGWLSLPLHTESLIGVENFVKHVRDKIYCSWDDINEGGLGLILIPSLKGLAHDDDDLPKQFQIIEKYIMKPDMLFECQTELIEAGFEEYAQI